MKTGITPVIPIYLMVDGLRQVVAQPPTGSTGVVPLHVTGVRALLFCLYINFQFDLSPFELPIIYINSRLKKVRGEFEYQLSILL